MNRFLILLISVLLFSCDDTPINTCNSEFFNENGILNFENNKLNIEKPTRINFYMESSGSMKGFLKNNNSTQFNKDTWSVISALSTVDSISLFENTGPVPRKITLGDFKNKMNKGLLGSVYSTDVPVMLKSVMGGIDSLKNNVAVLISDMKYSPVGLGNMQTLLNLYSVDIRNLFSNKSYAFSLIAAKSNFIGKQARFSCAESPYYFLVFGTPEKVTWVRANIIQLLSDSYLGDIDFNLEYNQPNYTALAYKDVENIQVISSENTKGYYSFSNYQSPAVFWLAVDFSYLAEEKQDLNYLRENISISSIHGMDVVIDEITKDLKVDPVNLKSKDMLYSHFIKIRVKNMPTSSGIIEVLLNDSENINEWINPLTEVLSENDCSGTYSLEQFIEGVSNAFKSTAKQKKEPLRILISTQKQ